MLLLLSYDIIYNRHFRIVSLKFTMQKYEQSLAVTLLRGSICFVQKVILP